MGTPPKEYYERYWDHPQALEPTYLAEERLQVLLRLLPKLNARTILDAGCGNGYCVGKLIDAGYSVTGMDVSEAAIVFAARTFPRATFECIAADQPWPFPDGSFDLVWSTEVVEHIFGVDAAFAEMSRVLKPGGHLALTTPYHGLLKNLALVLFGFERHFNVRGEHIRFFTNKALAEVCRDHQLEPLEWHHVGRVRWLAKSVFLLAKKRS